VPPVLLAREYSALVNKCTEFVALERLFRLPKLHGEATIPVAWLPLIPSS
jgi:hypothetical protein